MTDSNTTGLTFPMIHGNGTSAPMLREEIYKAYDALGVAYDDLKRSAPNGRDYYLQGSTALGAAIGEHESRLRRIESVRSELEEVLNSIDAQTDS